MPGPVGLFPTFPTDPHSLCRTCRSLHVPSGIKAFNALNVLYKSRSVFRFLMTQCYTRSVRRYAASNRMPGCMPY